MEPANAVNYMLERGQIEIHQTFYFLCLFMRTIRSPSSKHLNNTFSRTKLAAHLLGYFTENPPLVVDL